MLWPLGIFNNARQAGRSSCMGWEKYGTMEVSHDRTKKILVHNCSTFQGHLTCFTFNHFFLHLNFSPEGGTLEMPKLKKMASLYIEMQRPKGSVESAFSSYTSLLYMVPKGIKRPFCGWRERIRSAISYRLDNQLISRS